MEAPSLYNHIVSKQAILSELLLTVAQEFSNKIIRIEATEISPMLKLEHVIKLHIDLSFKYRGTMSLMLSEYVHLKDEDYTSFIALKSDYELKFRSIINECISSGSLVKEHTDLMVFTLLSTLRSMYAWIGKYRSTNKIELTMQVTRFLLYGVLVKR